MGLIKGFVPGSIRCVLDMKRAIEMTLNDLFDDVGSAAGSGPDRVDFTIEGDGVDLDLAIYIVDNQKHPAVMHAFRLIEDFGDEEVMRRLADGKSSEARWN